MIGKQKLHTSDLNNHNFVNLQTHGQPKVVRDLHAVAGNSLTRLYARTNNWAKYATTKLPSNVFRQFLFTFGTDVTCSHS